MLELIQLTNVRYSDTYYNYIHNYYINFLSCKTVYEISIIVYSLKKVFEIPIDVIS